MSDATTDSELPKVVIGYPSRPTRRAVFFTLLIASGFAIFDLAFTSIFNSLAFFLDGSPQSHLQNGAWIGLLSGALLVQAPIVWMWLHRYVSSRKVRWIAGLVICHVVMGLISLGSYFGGYTDWRWNVNAVQGCLTAYTYYVVQGACLKFLGMICGLQAIGGCVKQPSKFSLTELFALVFVIAVISAEMSLLSVPSNGLAVVTVMVYVIQLLIFAFISSLLVMLGIGSFLGRIRVAYAIGFVGLMVLGPLLFMVWRATSGVYLTPEFMVFQLSLWTYVFGCILGFRLYSLV